MSLRTYRNFAKRIAISHRQKDVTLNLVLAICHCLGHSPL